MATWNFTLLRIIFVYLSTQRDKKKPAKGRLLVRAAAWPLCMNDTSIMMVREFKEIFSLQSVVQNHRSTFGWNFPICIMQAEFEHYHSSKIFGELHGKA